MREFDLLKHVYDSNTCLGPDVVIPPGDDMGMVNVTGSTVLIGVDQLVDGSHVLSENTPLESIGRKAITRSLSDVAGMAARPLASLAAVTLPPDFGEDAANALFDAMRETAARYHAPLIGGDIAFHNETGQRFVCSVTVLAQPGRHEPVRRCGAQVGDTVYVTGKLGANMDSAGGGRHLTFAPRIDAALALADQLGDRLHAMIDISDGLGRDASHIAEQSHVQIVLQADRIPCRDQTPWRDAISQGEDYELCFAAVGDVPDSVEASDGLLEITPVGRVEQCRSDADRVIVQDHGTTIPADSLGWEHHTSERSR